MKKLLFLLLTIALIATSASAAKKEKAPKKGKEPTQQAAPTPAPSPYPTYRDGTFLVYWGNFIHVYDPMKGDGTSRFFSIWNDLLSSGSKSIVPYYLYFYINQFGNEVIYTLEFGSDYNFGSIPDGLIFNVDGNRTILRTKDNSVKAEGTSLYYYMTFSLDKATFERLANAKELFEYTPMVGDKYFKPVTLKGDALNAAKENMRRIIDNENLNVFDKE